MAPDTNQPHRPIARRHEFTWTAIGLGLLLSLVMGAANVYLGLRAGMTVSASIPAAVMAMGLFNGILRRPSILEANLVQTAASAGESLAAGVIFTMPALVIAGIWTSFDYWTVTSIALAGGWLGVLLMVPMRRVFVVDNPELMFPEGVACAEVLKAGDAAESAIAANGGPKQVFWGVAVGGIIKLAEGLLHLVRPRLEWATLRSGHVFYFGLDVSPALVSVGVIVGLPIAAQVFLGGAIGWLITIPLLDASQTIAVSAVDEAYRLWSEQVRYMGVGAMVVGGLVAIWRVRSGLLAAASQLRTAPAGGPPSNASQQDLRGRTLLTATFASLLVLGVLYLDLLDGEWVLTLVAMAAMVTMAFFFTAVASYIVGLVGNSNSPVSGMTITAVLATAALVYTFGYRGTEAMLATLGVAGVVCCVACTAGDVCNDLKTGQLVGASPRNQQLAQLLGVAVGSLAMAPVLTILHRGNADTGGIGGQMLPAPQAGLFATLVDGFFGRGELPWNMILYGALLGAAIAVADAAFVAAKAPYRLHVMPIAVGIYLPLGLATSILLGGTLAFAIARLARTQPASKRGLARAVLVASGLIAGEALTGVLLGGLAYAGVAETFVQAARPSDVVTLMFTLGVLFCLVAWFLQVAWKKQ